MTPNRHWAFDGYDRRTSQPQTTPQIITSNVISYGSDQILVSGVAVFYLLMLAWLSLGIAYDSA